MQKGLSDKKKILFYSCHVKPVCFFFLPQNTKEAILMKVSNRTAAAHTQTYIVWIQNQCKYMGANFLQNIFFCVLQMKESHTGLRK